VTINNNPKIF